jgi:alcohol dehydrogenase class IV
LKSSAKTADARDQVPVPENVPLAAPPVGIRPITLLQPARILFGDGCTAGFVEHLASLRLRRVLVVTSSPVLETCRDLLGAIEKAGVQLVVQGEINTEPTTAMFEACVKLARQHTLDGVIGLGGGSAMDVAKLVAALADGSQSLAQVFGINLLKQRSLWLACLPTTAGTGSEVSPIAILLDESCQLKKGIISPHLVPDVACVDPVLTYSVPPAVTASTGLDALTHCIEAYANRFAHPTVDVHALEGVRLISANLLKALANGRDAEARAKLALGSLYGGMCLGPVNTAAVHALAYPLGSEYHVAHGVSNALLLPHVLRFNFSAAAERYADIARALGIESAATPLETAERGVARLTELLAQCPIPQRISELGVPRDALPRLAKAAMTVTRLLKNNPRELSEKQAIAIYESAF